MKRNRTKRKNKITPSIVMNAEQQKKLDDSVFFPFGKYKNQQVSSVCKTDRSYCLWFVHNVVINSIAVGRVINVIAKTYLEAPSSSSSSCSPYYRDSEAYCDLNGYYDEDLADAYSFALHDGGGFPFL